MDKLIHLLDGDAKTYYDKRKNNITLLNINYIGFLYLNGKGVDKDSHKAKIFFELAYQEKYDLAIYNLGWIYEHGEGVHRCYQKAREYYEEAYKFGYDRSLVRLINLYKTTDLKYEEQYAIKYFIRIKHSEKLKDIYGYNDKEIKLLIEKRKLEKRMNKLKKQNKKLKEEIVNLKKIEVTPGGPI